MAALPRQVTAALAANAGWLSHAEHPLGLATTLGIPGAGRKFLSRCFGQGALPHVSRGLDREDAVVAMRFARTVGSGGNLGHGHGHGVNGLLLWEEGVPCGAVSADWCRHYGVAVLGEETIDGAELLAGQPDAKGDADADADAAAAGAADMEGSDEDEDEDEESKETDPLETDAAGSARAMPSASSGGASGVLVQGTAAHSKAVARLTAPCEGVVLPVRDMLVAFIAGLLGAGQPGVALGGVATGGAVMTYGAGTSASEGDVDSIRVAAAAADALPNAFICA